MNAILSLSHFCEIHGPTVLFSTQAFHFSVETKKGTLNPTDVKFFGPIKKLEEYNTRVQQNFQNLACEVGRC